MSNDVFPSLDGGALHLIPVFRTVVEEYRGGSEQRDARWLAPRFRFEIEDDPMIKIASWKSVLAHYVKHKARFESSLFQDWTTKVDYGALGTRTDERLGEGNGSNLIFYLYENKVDSAVIYKDAVVQTQDSQVVVDEATGKVTFVTAPASGAKITADVVNGFFRVRFDMDDVDWERIRGAGWRGRISLYQIGRASG